MDTLETEGDEQKWIPQSIVDSSHLLTFLISISVIVYGSFRSLNFEQEKLNEKLNEKPGSESSYTVQTLSSHQAIFIPVAASLSLLIMFFFFESIQTVFLLCTAVLATVAFSFLLLPMCKSLFRICSCRERTKISCCFLGKFSLAEILSFMISLSLVSVWIVTGHWLLMDILGMGFCVTFIAIVRLPSLKVSMLLLVGLVIYDIFWVYFSHFIFSTNVMIRVATREADNPFKNFVKKFNLGANGKYDTYKLALPGKLVIPSYSKGNFSMLGLGDIVMPGLLLCFVLRFDAYKRQQIGEAIVIEGNDEESLKPLTKSSSTPSLVKPLSYRHYRFQRITYFHCSLIGYLTGLITATLSSEIFKAAQPALIFLVPFTLLPLMIMAYLKGDLKKMWNEPFAYSPPKYFYV